MGESAVWTGSDRGMRFIHRLERMILILRIDRITSFTEIAQYPHYSAAPVSQAASKWILCLLST